MLSLLPSPFCLRKQAIRWCCPYSVSTSQTEGNDWFHLTRRKPLFYLKRTRNLAEFYSLGMNEYGYATRTSFQGWRLLFFFFFPPDTIILALAWSWEFCILWVEEFCLQPVVFFFYPRQLLKIHKLFPDSLKKHQYDTVTISFLFLFLVMTWLFALKYMDLGKQGVPLSTLIYYTIQVQWAIKSPLFRL